MNLIFYFFVILFTISCSTRQSIKLRSVPDGANLLKVESDGSTRSFGKTPLETTESMRSILVEKEGYESVQIFLGQVDSQHYEYTVKLKAKLQDTKEMDIKSKYEKLAKGIAQANNLIQRKRYPEADALLINITNDYPFVSVGYDLLGNIHYLQKDFRSAIGYYQKSLELNPENIETKQVLDRLRSMSN